MGEGGERDGVGVVSASLTQCEGICWYVTLNGEEIDDGDGYPHYSEAPARQEASDRAADATSDEEYDPDGPREYAAVAMPAPCWSVKCAGCGYVLDGEGWAVTHFASADDARESARDCDWTWRGDDDAYCWDCLPPRDDEDDA